MKTKDYIIRGVRYLYRKGFNRKFLNPICDMNRQSVNSKIFDLLSRKESCMISRFGATELNCINNYLTVSSAKENYLKCLINFIIDNTHTPWWNEDHFKIMSTYSGVFPPSEKTSINFALRYLEDAPFIDLLGSFQYYEKFMPLKENTYRAQLETLYPFFVDLPWTRALQGKNILVIHPFEKTIRSQYLRRSSLFDNEMVLPDFNLITLKAIQSVGGTKVSYKSWFDALKYMENEISKINFDICILGCGAYGLPLAAHVKRIGKKAVHLGGGTQLLFGIKGKRWAEQYDKVWEYRPEASINTNYSDLFNSSWVYPDETERPKNSNKVENSCYW